MVLWLQPLVPIMLGESDHNPALFVSFEKLLYFLVLPHDLNKLLVTFSKNICPEKH